MSRHGLAGLAVVALAAAGCDVLMTEPAPPPATIEVSFQIAPAQEVVGGPAEAFAKVRRVFLRFARSDDTVRDTVLAVTPVEGRIRLPIALEVEERIDALGIAAQLGVGTSTLFEGTTLARIVPGEPTRASVDLVPVPGLVVADRLALAIPNIQQTVQLSSAVLFASSDTIPGLTGTWLSEDPSIIAVTPDGLAMAVELGQTRLEVRYGILADTIVAGTSPVDTIEVTPPSATLAIGQGVQLVAVLRDADGNTLFGRQVSWVAVNPNVVRVDPTGFVTGASSGSTNVVVSSGSATTSVPITVF